ncbi:hypothetical protein CHS0354_008674 [Potamilus streckersoni]|uniref:Neurochondrin n=1 Tax=Potamilus streckersoni TaxID=2493646 RepID=A0AAE0THN7_9BIVA|nr:hypothetical protein CHS0354_008674 [Potamilus streckersoni]
MDGEKSTNILEKCLTALKTAKSDNDMFAALFMITKITKGSECDQEIKLKILDAINPQFFTRLLKTKVVPEGCSAIVYKDLALSILSALCTDPVLAVHEAVRRNIATLNEAVLTESSCSESQKGGSDIVDDCLAIFSVLSQSEEGQVLLYQETTVSALADITQNQTYGHEKAYDILLHVLNECGPITWQYNKQALNQLVQHLAALFHKDQTARKFELCKTLTFFLTTMPVHMVQEEDPPWLDDIVAGFEYMFRSRLDVIQRELSLRLAAVLVDMCGVKFILPPHTKDSKTFLLMTHLCCVEVRMVLEEPDTQKVFLKSSLLSSCYTLLESVINFMINGPVLRLDDRQVVQLNSAMVGAFGAVLFFLQKIAQESPCKWDSIVFATVRVLAAWIAEETSALREKVYSLIPFLLRISNMSLKPQFATENEDQVNLRDVLDQANAGSDIVTVQELSGKKQEDTTVKTVEFPSETSEQKCLPKEADSLKDNAEWLNERKAKSADEESPVTLLDSGDNILSACDIDSQQFKESLQISSDDNPAERIKELGNWTIPPTDKIDQHNSQITKKCSDSKPEPESSCLSSTLETGHIANQELDNQGKTDCTSVHSITDGACGNSSICDVSLENNRQGDLLEEKNPGVCAFRGFDILRFLLPGFCHLTTEDQPRSILMEHDLPELLEYYFNIQWNRYSHEMGNREIQVGLIILCNIFLNLTVLEMQIVKDCQTFHRILNAVVQIANTIGDVEGQLCLSSHLVALGLMMFRQQADRFNSSDEHLDKFFQMAILFVRGAFVGKQRKKNVFLLCLTEQYCPVWNQISQTWFLSMQALAACFPLYPDLYKILLKSGWIPSLLKMLNEVKDRDLDEETRGSYLRFLCAACQNPTCKLVIRDQGGLDVARLYGSKDLMELLQKS